MLHKALFVNEKYKKISDSAKVTYAILNDRVSLSIKYNLVGLLKPVRICSSNPNS
ncbi:replication initiator protein A [Staphylococcus hominis]|uniref:replication initiator protein A n=1 Tax=Staphylococcus hominis TaxID=1290 RepID=UPI0039BFD9CC